MRYNQLTALIYAAKLICSLALPEATSVSHVGLIPVREKLTDGNPKHFLQSLKTTELKACKRSMWRKEDRERHAGKRGDETVQVATNRLLVLIEQLENCSAPLTTKAAIIKTVEEIWNSQTFFFFHCPFLGLENQPPLFFKMQQTRKVMCVFVVFLIYN